MFSRMASAVVGLSRLRAARPVGEVGSEVVEEVVWSRSSTGSSPSTTFTFTRVLFLLNVGKIVEEEDDCRLDQSAVVLAALVAEVVVVLSMKMYFR